MRRTNLFPVVAKFGQQSWRQGDQPLFGSLAVSNPQLHPPAVDVGNCQCRRFAQTQSGGVKRQQYGAVFQGADTLQQLSHFFGTQYDRQFLRALAEGNHADSPAAGIRCSEQKT